MVMLVVNSLELLISFVFSNHVTLFVFALDFDLSKMSRLSTEILAGLHHRA